MTFKNFSSIEIDAIGEILNISLGASATAISTMLGKRVDITTPDVNIISFDEFDYADLEPAVGVEITYVSGLSGSNIMLLKRHDVKVIVELLMGMEMSDEEFELNEMNMSAVCEVMNQMMGASSTALSEFLGEVVNISTPVSFEVGEPEEFKKKCFDGQEYMVVVNFNLKIDELVESRFMYLMTIQLAKRLVSVFGLGHDEDDDIITTETPAPVQTAEPEPSNKTMSQEEIEALMQQQTPEPELEASNKMMSQEEIEALMQQQTAAPEPEPSNKMMSQEEIEALMQQQTATPQPAPTPQPVAPQQAVAPQAQAAPVNDMQQQMMQMMQMMQQQMMAMQQMQPQAAAPQQRSQRMIEAHPLDTPQFSTVADSLGEEQTENLQLIMDVPLEISVEIGRTKKLIKDILELSSGSLVVLDKLAGEQVDVYANGQCIAKGDVVVVDDNFGVRITEVIKRPELLQQ